MASQITVLSEPSPAPEEPYDAETASENDEVDQLADAEEEAPSSPETAREVRLPGTSLFPADAVERVTQSHGATHTVGMSREASYVLSIATEDFIKRLVQGAYEEAQGERRNMISYHDVAATTQQYQELFFLQETIPQPMALSDALLASEQREKELMSEDPAIAPEAPADVPPTYISSGYTSKSRPAAAHSHSYHQPHHPSNHQPHHYQPHPPSHPPSHANTPAQTPAPGPAPPPASISAPAHPRGANGHAARAPPMDDEPYARRHPYRDETYANGRRPRPPVPLAPSASASPPPHEYVEAADDRPYTVPPSASARTNRSSMPIDALMNPADTFADLDRGRTIYSQE
ncbi:hypothetical protein HDZ31DRAFT_60403 [Schizophyllum fasciatum]